jgi:hypothetical protein
MVAKVGLAGKGQMAQIVEAADIGRGDASRTKGLGIKGHTLDHALGGGAQPF